MIKKLIILILFIAISLIAIGFVTIPEFGFASQFKVGEKAVELAEAKQATVIDIPLVGKFMGGKDIQIVVAFDDVAGYTEILQDTEEEVNTYSQAEAIMFGAQYVSGAAVCMWLFFLLMIILLPRKHGKKKIKKLARNEALDVVDEEMDNMAPARSYAPAPRRRPEGGHGGEGRRRRDDYDDDYDY